MCILNLFFLLGLRLFCFPYLLNFSQNCFFPKLVLFFLFLQGEKAFFKTYVGFRRSCCSSQRKLTLFSIELNSFMFPWLSIFSYPLLCMFSVCLLIRLSLSIHDKKGEKYMKFEKFLKCSYLGGVSLFQFAFDFIFVFILFICLYFHTCRDVFL